MEVNYPAAGLDIGTEKVSVVIGQYGDKGHFELLGHGVSKKGKVSAGVVVNIESTLEAVREATDMAEQEAGIEITDMTVGMGGDHIKGANSKGVTPVSGRNQEISKDDIDRVIDSAKTIVIPMDRTTFHVLPQEFIVDRQTGIKNPLDMSGQRLEATVHVITGSIALKENLAKCVNRASFRVDNMIYNALASSSAVLEKDEKEMGVLYIDMGAGTTDIMVFLDGAPYYTSVLNMGADVITSDISKICRTPKDIVEEIKIHSGCACEDLCDKERDVIFPQLGGRPSIALGQSYLARVIEARVFEMFEAIKRDIERKGLLSRINAGVVITGGGANLEGIDEAAKRVFAVPSRIGSPLNCTSVSSELFSPEFSTAIGLAQWGARMEGARSFVPARRMIQGEGLLQKASHWLKEFF